MNPQIAGRARRLDSASVVGVAPEIYCEVIHRSASCSALHEQNADEPANADRAALEIRRPTGDQAQLTYFQLADDAQMSATIYEVRIGTSESRGELTLNDVRLSAVLGG